MKKSRKKMLLSSIAMLLVALIALGSATFAWYITNARVYADASFAAASASGLVIREKTSTPGAWLAKVTLADKTGMMPASTNYADSLGTLVAAKGDGTDYDDGELSGGTLEGELTQIADITNSADIYYKQVEVASSSASSSDCYLKITGTAKNGTYMTILVYDSTGARVAKLTSGDLNTDKSTYMIAQKTGTTYQTARSGDPAVATAVSLDQLGETKILTKYTAPSKDGSDDPLTFTIVAFADGYNAKCKNETANTTDIGVKLDFRTTAW